MSTLPELQAPINAAIVRAMVESTPDQWQQVVLKLTRPPNYISVEAFLHELVSPEGFPPVTPVDELFEHTFQLDELVRGHNCLISSATYVASLIDGQWSYRVNFEYEQAAL